MSVSAKASNNTSEKIQVGRPQMKCVITTTAVDTSEVKPLAYAQREFYQLFQKNFGAYTDEEGNVYPSIIDNLNTDVYDKSVDNMLSMTYDYFGVFEDDVTLPSDDDLDDTTMKATTLRILNFCEDRLHLKTRVEKRVFRPADTPKPLVSAWNTALTPDEKTIKKVQLPKKQELFSENPMFRVRMCRMKPCTRRNCSYAHSKEELLKPLCKLDQTCNDSSCQLRHNPRMSEGKVGSLGSSVEYPLPGQKPAVPGSRIRTSQKKTKVKNVYTNLYGALAEESNTRQPRRAKPKFARATRATRAARTTRAQAPVDDGFTVVTKKAKRGAAVPNELLFTHKYMCKFHQQGSCRNGKNCKFAHNQATIDAANKLHARKSEKVCWNGDNCRNADCRFQH